MLLSLVISLAVIRQAAAQDFALKILNESPRHHEWVAVPQVDRQVHSFVVYPEVQGKALAVVIIHENRGLTDWVRRVPDRVAAAGYIAIAPDLLSGTGPGGGKTSDFTDSDAARQGIYKLCPEQVMADLNAATDCVTALPAANGKVAVAGFCWGGSQTFRFATDRAVLSTSFVFYGTGPEDKAAIRRITAPVYGFYGGDDARVNKTLSISTKLMKEAGKTYETVTYDGAGHAFMHRGEDKDPKETNTKAMKQAWTRWLDLLKGL
jgi:carboxymethylenebutenolidase